LWSQESKYLKPNLLMLRSEGSESKLKLWTRRTGIPVLCLLAVLVLPASAQDFSLTAAPFNPDAIAPGGTSASNITMVTNTGFTGPVTLGCVVTAPVQLPPADIPVCQVSPPSLAAAGGAIATITTNGSTSTIGYTVTITGTDSSGTQSQPLQLTVLSVTPQFTITVQTAIAPTSVVAGTGAEGVVNINPLDGYMTPSSGYITLYCSSMTPLVTIAPVCLFSYPPGQKGLTVTGNTSVTSILTINTFGPVPTGAAAHPRNFYALWLSIPVLGLAGLGAAASDKRSRKIWGVVALVVLGGALLLLPACSNTGNTVSTTTPNGTTPANTYTFTIVGVDTNGVVSSNTGSTTSAGPTVSLTVTTPK
jgi:hypothetical protein